MLSLNVHRFCSDFRKKKTLLFSLIFVLVVVFFFLVLILSLKHVLKTLKLSFSTQVNSARVREYTFDHSDKS